MLNKKYFSVTELLERWDTNLYDILYLAENKVLTLKLRAFGILGTYCQLQKNGELSYELPLKSCEMNGIFPISLKSARQIILNRVTELNTLLPTQKDCDYIKLGESLKIGLEDLVVLEKDKERVEKDFGFLDSIRKVKNISPADNIDDFFIEELPNGHTRFCYHGKTYTYGRVQASIIKQLYDAAKDGRIWMYGKTLLKNAGSSSFRLGDIFKPHRDWMEIVKGNNQGLYRLYLE